MSVPLLQHLAPVPEEAFYPILKELERRPIPVNPYRKKAGEGRSAAFGFVNRRSQPPDISRLCWQRPYLYKLLVEFGRRYVPISWTSITVNQDYAAAPHRDRGNQGLSYLVAFGEYQEGELQIHEAGDCSGTFGIRHQPILFDGAKLLHSVRPFTGHRYSLVFYTLDTLPTKRLEQYEPVEEDGKWVLHFKDTEGRVQVLKRGQGLPHPLAGRRSGGNETLSG